MMKNIVLSVVCVLLGGMVMPVFAVDVDVDIRADLKVASSYVWRGEVINDEAVIQPSLTFASADWGFNVWGTWDLTDATNSSARTRMDFMLDYTIVSGKHMLRPGIVAYIFHDATYSASDDTFEVLMKYALDVTLLPSLTVNYDFGEIEGIYASLALGHSFELIKDKMDIDLKMDIGVANEDYAKAKFTYPKSSILDSSIEPTFTPEDTSLIDLTVRAEFPLVFGQTCTFIPGVEYMTLLDSDIKDAAKDSGEDTHDISYSLMLSMTF